MLLFLEGFHKGYSESCRVCRHRDHTYINDGSDIKVEFIMRVP